MSVDALYEQAKESLLRGDYQEARELGHRLLKMRFSGAFEILAESFEKAGELPIAIRVLENGVQEAPSVWPLWLRLGNYRSQAGDLEGALQAYDGARSCPGVDIPQVDFNEGLMRLLFGNKARALELFSQVIGSTDDKKLRLLALIRRLTTLIETDRVTEALMELGEAQLHEADNAELLSTMAFRLMEKGDERNAVNLARQALGLRRAGEVARVLRRLEGPLSESARPYLVTMRGRIEEEETTHRFLKTSRVYADTPEEAWDLAVAFEPPDVRPELEMVEVETLGPAESENKGVDWSSGLDFFGPEDK